MLTPGATASRIAARARRDDQPGGPHLVDLLRRLVLDVQLPAEHRLGLSPVRPQRVDRPDGDVLHRTGRVDADQLALGAVEVDQRRGVPARTPAAARRSSRPCRRRAGTARRRSGRRRPPGSARRTSTCQILPQPRQVRRPDSRRITSSSSTTSSSTRSSADAEVGQQLVQRGRLRHGAREAVEQEAVAGVRLGEPVPDHVDGDLVRHQLAGVHVPLGLDAQRGALR